MASSIWYTISSSDRRQVEALRPLHTRAVEFGPLCDLERTRVECEGAVRNRCKTQENMPCSRSRLPAPYEL